jgi:hypothetical protein
MPYRIYRYAWAYFESCWPDVEGWLEPAPYGTYAGGYGTICEYDIVLPAWSTIQCLTTRIH